MMKALLLRYPKISVSGYFEASIILSFGAWALRVKSESDTRLLGAPIINSITGNSRCLRFIAGPVAQWYGH